MYESLGEEFYEKFKQYIEKKIKNRHRYLFYLYIKNRILCLNTIGIIKIT